MRWTVLFLAGCVARLPAYPLPSAPPPIDAPDYATGPLGDDASTYQRRAVANLQLGAAVDRIGVESDERLSRVASRVAWEFAASGRLPSTSAVQQMATDAGSPYVVGVVAVETLPRRRPIVHDLYLAHGRKVPGSGLPLAAGVGAWEQGEDTVLALVLVRRPFWLDGTVPKEGAAVVPLIGAFQSPSYGLLAVDAAGEHLTTAEAGEGSTASPAVPVRDGWVEVLGVDGPSWTPMGVLRLGEPPPVPEADPNARVPGSAVASGIERLRAAWGRPPMRLVGGEAACGTFPDEAGGVEVTRDQKCVAVPLTHPDEAWDALVRRPIALRAMADPAAELGQLGIDADGGTVTLRTMRVFERLTSEAATERLAAAIEARWPGIRRDPDSPYPELARGYAVTGDPAAGRGELATRAEDATVRWIEDGSFLWSLSANQYVPALLDAVKPETPPVGYGVGVALGAGTDGEPMYYAAIGLRL